jgi:cysteine desulfurase
MAELLYLDDNASAPLDPEIAAAMAPFLGGFAGNSSSRHAAGRAARRAVEAARDQIARALHCETSEIVFTSGASEANNLAVAGAGPIFISAAEHPSALEPARELARRGAKVFELPLNEEGFVRDLEEMESADSGLAVVQLASGETGAIQDVAGLAAANGKLRFHCDAVQAVGRIPVDFKALGVTSLTISGHKLHGPVGIGALVVRSGASLRPLIRGGSQQESRRAGTEPVAAIVGLGLAVAKSVALRTEIAPRLAALRDRLEHALCESIPDVVVNGPRDPLRRLPNTLNVSFLGAPAQAHAMALDLAGVCCSAGSACASGSQLPSYALQQMGLPDAQVRSALRFSFGRFTTEATVDAAILRIVAAARAVRANFAG